MQIEHISDGIVCVTMRSMFTGRLNSMELPVRQGQIEYWKLSGKPIQKVFPHLSADQREFLMTGVTSAEWANAFGEDA